MSVTNELDFSENALFVGGDYAPAPPTLDYEERRRLEADIRDLRALDRANQEKVEAGYTLTQHERVAWSCAVITLLNLEMLDRGL